MVKMNRQTSLDKISTVDTWDIIIIGGGATGMGIALDATTRGLKTLLVEKGDLANGTSSRSTKLVHGGVRYLKQFHFKLVFEAIKERKIILKNAPHLSSALPFIIPIYSYFNMLYYGIGLFLYEMLAGWESNIGRTTLLSRKSTINNLPFIKTKNLKGGILYYDAQFNDSQLCIDIAATATNNDATIINYFECADFIKSNEKVIGIQGVDRLSQKKYTIKGKNIINATGVFSDTILQMDDPQKSSIIKPSKGVHLVFNDPGKTLTKYALMSPIKQDDRVIFVIPWMGKLLVGTTDTPIEKITTEPAASMEDVAYLLNLYNSLSENKIDKNSVVSMFAGLRPLIKLSDEDATALISREHSILTSASGIITIAGGKWTTYRKMAEDVMELVIANQKLPNSKCKTEYISVDISAVKNKTIESYILSDKSLAEKIHPAFSFTKAQVVYAIQHEMAMTIEDVLARRIRLLFLDAKAAIEAAKEVAKIFVNYANKEDEQMKEQMVAFEKIANKYLLN